MSIATKIGLFVGGFLTGTCGMKILASDEAKTVYAHTAAAALRVKDQTMKQVTSVREVADDVLAEAKKINEEKAVKAEKEVIEDAAKA